MEAKRFSRKRKRSFFSSNPFMGTFTRSKSQIFVHRSRSGSRRPDSVNPKNPLARFSSVELTKRASRNQQHLTDGDDISRILIKDLRVRRIFSPSSNGDVSDDKERIEDGLSRKTRKLKGTNPNLSSIDENGEIDREASGEDRNLKLEEDGKVPYRVVNWSGECVLATPPEAEIAGKLEKRECDFEAVDFVQPKLSNGGLKERCGDVGEDLGTQTNRRSGSISRPKSILNTRPRSKIFKPAGSISYRRLLPYLMDMENDDSSNSPGDPKIDQSIKNDVGLEDQSVQPLATNKQETSLDKGYAKNSADNLLPSDSGTNGLLGGSEENLTSLEFITESQMPSGSNVCISVSAGDASCPKTPMKDGIKEFDANPPSVTDTEGNTNVFKVEQKDDYENPTDSFNEEFVQFTPPDVTICSKPKVDETESSRAEHGLLISKHIIEKSPRESTSRHNSLLHDKRNYSSSKGKLALNQCSRLKLFRSPGSFSYRRLLPYLMEVAKDNSSASRNNQFPKIEGLEEKPLQPFLGSDCKIIPQDKSIGNNNHTEKLPGHSDTMLREGSNTVCGSTNIGEPNLTSLKHIKDNLVATNLQEACYTINHVRLDEDPKLETITNMSLSIHGSNSPSVPVYSGSAISHGSSSEKGANTASQFSCFKTEEGSNKLIVPLAATHLFQNSPFSSFDSRRGILKRNPRGCRGLCTCLNCSSFRLNAEKAFEFSRNQMQDTEQLTLDLINELANLRNMLEKSGGGAGIWANQVNEACRKASEVEELAKQRLGQMNDDLNIHCRITCTQRPRVKFANYIEEKAIPLLQPPSTV